VRRHDAGATGEAPGSCIVRTAWQMRTKVDSPPACPNKNISMRIRENALILFTFAEILKWNFMYTPEAMKGLSERLAALRRYL